MDEENQDIMERKDDGCAGSSNEAICVCVCLSWESEVLCDGREKNGKGREKALML